VVKITSTKYIDSTTIIIYKYNDKMNRRSLLQQNSLNVYFETDIVIVETNNNQNKVPDAPYAYSHFKEAMATSLSDGSFIRLLKSSGLPTFDNVTVSADSFQALTYTVKYTDLFPTAAPTPAPTMTIDSIEKLSSVALIGIIAAGIFIATFAFIGLFFYVETHRKRKSGKIVPIVADMDMTTAALDMDSRYFATSRNKSNLSLDSEELELSSLGNDDVVDDEADNVLEILKETWIADFGNVDSQVPDLEPIDNSLMYFDPHLQHRSTISTDDDYTSDAASIKYVVKDGSQPLFNRKMVLTKFPKINVSRTKYNRDIQSSEESYL